MGLVELFLGRAGDTQPEVPTSGIRKAYKVFGLIDSFSGRLCSKAHTGRFNSESYAAFLLDVLARTTQHGFVIQDGARYHTSKAMEEFFAAHSKRLTKVQWPAYAPDFNPIEYLWKKVKKMATHLKHFPQLLPLYRQRWTKHCCTLLKCPTRSWL